VSQALKLAFDDIRVDRVMEVAQDHSVSSFAPRLISMVDDVVCLKYFALLRSTVSLVEDFRPFEANCHLHLPLACSHKLNTELATSPKTSVTLYNNSLDDRSLDMHHRENVKYFQYEYISHYPFIICLYRLQPMLHQLGIPRGIYRGCTN
jgi:hypothetical protein